MPASTDTDQLLEDVLARSVPLHAAIAVFDEPAGARYELAGPPGVAFFERDTADTISHASSSPSPLLAPVLDELRERHLAAAGVDSGGDNSHLAPLLLLCLMLLDDDATRRFRLDQLARGQFEIEAIDEEAGRHDPPLAPGDAALRSWVPLHAAHMPDAGVHPAILELRFRRRRSPRYAPW
jgi:hypothetical protein